MLGGYQSRPRSGSHRVMTGFAPRSSRHTQFFAVATLLLLLSGFVHAVEWVPVAEEPRHRLVFENEEAVVLDVHLPPGYVSLYHEHKIDLLYVTIVGTQVWAEALNGQRMEADVPTGDLRFSSDNHGLPHIHRVGNVGERPFHIIGVGRKGASVVNPEFVPIEGDTEGLLLEQEKSHAQVYRISLQPGEATGEHHHNLPHTHVFLTDGVISDGTNGATAVSAGQFLWQPGNTHHRYINKSQQVLEIVEVQWR